MMVASRRRSKTLLLLMLVSFALAVEPASGLKLPVKLLGKAAGWVGSTLGSHLLGKAIDSATGQDVKSQIEAEIPRLLGQVGSATGDERLVLEQYLSQLERQLQVLDRTLALAGRQVDDLRVEAAQLQAEQDQIANAVEDLSRRTARLEGRVSELDSRVSDLELALISECLDLRSAPVLGAEGFRVAQSSRSQLSDRFDSEQLSLNARLYLNSCTPDLTQRGLLLQLSWVSRGLSRDLSLFATYKQIDYGSYGGSGLGHLARIEFPFDRPTQPVDGQVVELFIPYVEIPFPSTNQLALALVLTHDGRPIYSLADQVIHCVFGQRVNCRWR